MVRDRDFERKIWPPPLPLDSREDRETDIAIRLADDDIGPLKETAVRALVEHSIISETESILVIRGLVEAVKEEVSDYRARDRLRQLIDAIEKHVKDLGQMIVEGRSPSSIGNPPETADSAAADIDQSGQAPGDDGVN